MQGRGGEDGLAGSLASLDCCCSLAQVPQTAATLRQRWGSFLPSCFVITLGRPVLSLACCSHWIAVAPERTGQVREK